MAWRGGMAPGGIEAGGNWQPGSPAKTQADRRNAAHSPEMLKNRLKNMFW
jgi:hypothetical protein